jgi:AraC family transcriptional activator of pobA
MSAKNSIHTYNLFGETSELDDVLHCEPIEARSRLHNWELEPHRHTRLHQMLFVTDGGGEAELDGRRLPLAAPCFINVPAGVIHGFRFMPQTAGWVLTLTAELLDQCLGQSSVQGGMQGGGQGGRLRAPLEIPAVLPLPRAMGRNAKQLQKEFQGIGFARGQVLGGLAAAQAAQAARLIHQHHPTPGSASAHPLFARFEELVERDFKRQRRLASYAAELAVSPTHLNRIVQQSTGRPASKLVSDRILREARRLLIYTNLSASQVAYELGFNDPAHFSRVFTRGTGLPPRRFRQQQEAG